MGRAVKEPQGDSLPWTALPTLADSYGRLAGVQGRQGACPSLRQNGLLKGREVIQETEETAKESSDIAAASGG